MIEVSDLDDGWLGFLSEFGELNITFLAHSALVVNHQIQNRYNCGVEIKHFFYCYKSFPSCCFFFIACMSS